MKLVNVYIDGDRCLQFHPQEPVWVWRETVWPFDEIDDFDDEDEGWSERYWFDDEGAEHKYPPEPESSWWHLLRGHLIEVGDELLFEHRRVTVKRTLQVEFDFPPKRKRRHRYRKA